MINIDLINVLKARIRFTYLQASSSEDFVDYDAAGAIDQELVQGINTGRLVRLDTTISIARQLLARLNGAREEIRRLEKENARLLRYSMAEHDTRMSGQ